MGTRKEEKRMLILEAAFQLFLTKGYQNTKIIEIAEAAGIGKGTIYEYYNSKEELFCELFELKVTSRFTKIQDVLSDASSCSEQLEAALRFNLDNAAFFGKNKNILPYLMPNADLQPNPTLVTAMNNLFLTIFKPIHEIIKKGISSGEFIKADPLMLTLSIIGAMDCYISFGYDLITPVEGICNHKNTPWDSEEFFQLIFNGLKERH